MPKDADKERKAVEEAVLVIARGGDFVCPECGMPSREPVANAEHGFVCSGCDWVLNLID